MNTAGHNSPQSNNTANNLNPIQDDLHPSLHHALQVRSQVLRHIPFDPDHRAFVVALGPAPFKFAENWGFEKMPHGHHWTAKGLFDLTGLPPAPPGLAVEP